MNERGRQQSQALAQALAGEGLTRVVASTLGRAREAAQIMADRLGLAPPDLHPGLRERNFGMVQGVPKAELAELNPVLHQQILKRNPAANFDQGESMDEFADRVIDAILDVADRYWGEHVLVITHGWVMDVLTRHVHHLPRSTALAMKRRNAECLWLEVSGESIRLMPGRA